MCPRRVRLFVPLAALLLTTACGSGSSSSSTAPSATYTLGATVNGLQAGQSVTLAANGSSQTVTGTAP